MDSEERAFRAAFRGGKTAAVFQSVMGIELFPREEAEMSEHSIDYDEACPACNATGLYVGMAERDGGAVVCYKCQGTGCHHVTIQYSDFEGRQDREGVRRVVESNPGIVIDDREEFGGLTYEDWKAGKPFGSGMEMRERTCPAWWYQGHKRDPQWRKCITGVGLGDRFSQCRHFKDKAQCWAEWDEEFLTEGGGA